MEKAKRIWALLAKKEINAASQNELEELDQLLKEHPDIQQVTIDLDLYWLQVKKCSDSEQLQAITQSNKILSETILDLQKQRVSHPRSVLSKRLLATVTILLLVICGSYVLYTFTDNKNINIVHTNNGVSKELMLPDNSKVILNSGSTITYSKSFKDQPIREVTVTGEAYFEVKHDSRHPFIIHTTHLDIRDLGTVFNIKAYPNEPTETTLISGSIEVRLKDNPETTLKLNPNEKAVYGGVKKSLNGQEPVNKEMPKHEGQLKILKISRLIGQKGDTIVPETAWTHHQLVFQSETFDALAKRLERLYNVQFHFEDKAIQDYVFTGIFDKESLDQALQELQLSRPFSYRIKEKNDYLNSGL